MTVDPSSLIFVAIIGIWAAYLLGHWVRRRDQLATARSIDRFSHAMRVLDRRAPVPTVPLQRTARAHVVASVRAPVRASVNRSVRTSVVMPAPGTPAQPASGGSPRRESRHSTAAQTGASSTGASTTGASTTGASAIARGVTPSASTAAARRTRVLLVLLGATVLGWGLAAGTAVTWVTPAVVTVLLVAFVAGLRGAVLRERRGSASVRSTVPSPRVAGQRAAGQQAAPSVVTRDQRLARRAAVRAEQSPAEVSGSVERSSAGDLGATGPTAATALHPPSGNANAAPPAAAATITAPVAPYVDAERADEADLIDLAALEAEAARQHADSEAAAAWPSAPVGPGWQPVPVPPPTYTLKPKAPAVVRSGQPLPGAPAAATSTFDLDEILERRIASG